jgi:CDP-diacylglycerol--glycerol-3-phosphate 3-phosphatidyltransferase
VNDQPLRKSNLTLPNVLTTLRIVMALVAAVLFVSHNNEKAAVLLCVIAALLDAFDGWYARKYSQCTRLGEHLDPLADKLLMAVVYAVIAWKAGSPLVWWIVGLIALREVGMTIFRAYSLRRFRKFIPANALGKAKMILQSTFGLIILGYAHFWNSGFGFPLSVVLVPLLIILVISYYSALVYLIGWRNAQRVPPEKVFRQMHDNERTGAGYQDSERAVAGE